MEHYRYRVLLLTTLAFATTMTARLVISPLVPGITTSLNVSTSEMGLVLTGMWAAYAVSQYPGGFLANTYGERHVILAAIGSIAVTSVLLAVAPIFWLFAIVTIVLGAGAGLPYSATTSLLSTNFDDIGSAIGVYIAGGPFAGLVVPIVATRLGTMFGWRAAMLVGAVVAVPVFVAIALGIDTRLRDDEHESADVSPSSTSVFELVGRPGIRYTILIAVGGAFTWQAIASFLPTFLVEYWALSIQRAGVLFSVYFVVHGLTQPVTGWVSDRVGRDWAGVLTTGGSHGGTLCASLRAESGNAPRRHRIHRTRHELGYPGSIPVHGSATSG